MRPSHCDVSLVRLGGWWALGRLARSTAGEDIKWNFGKFLVGRDGKVISRYLPTTSPSSIESDIQAALAADSPREEI